MPRSASRLSISTRLALWYGLSVTLLLGLFVAFLYIGFHVSLHRDFDAALAAEVERVEAMLPSGMISGSEGDPGEPFTQAAAASPYAVHLFSPSGEPLFANGRLPDVTPHAPGAGEGVSYHTHGDDDRVRTRYAEVQDADGQVAVWVAVTGTESGLLHETHRLGWLLAFGVLLGVTVAALSGYGLARRALRPVSALTEAAGQIGPAERGARLPVGNAPRDELGDLAMAFNGLLERLDAGFERERRFRADAAHELLTPVTAARSEIDVVLRREREAEGYREVLGRLDGHVERMAGLVTGLLALSRAEAEGAPVIREAVDLGPLVGALADRTEPVAAAKGVGLVRELGAGVIASGSEADVEVAVENLLDNAVKYTPRGGTVTVSVRVENGEAVAAVSDTGAGIEPGERTRLFERFYRADDPYVQEQSGSGLGLSIAQRLAERYGGRVTATSPGPGAGSTFELRLPRAGSSGSMPVSLQRPRDA